jgi:RNA recognition motif-containing protein
MKIYVGNLDYKVQDEDLIEIFKEYGEVLSAKIITDRHSGRNKGFGFVEMSNDVEAKRSIEELNQGLYFGRKIIVNEARPQTERSSYSRKY